MQTKYCPRCHREAYRVEEDGDSIRIIQNRKSLIKMDRNSSSTIKVTCPFGHPVKVEMK